MAESIDKLMKKAKFYRWMNGNSKDAHRIWNKRYNIGKK